MYESLLVRHALLAAARSNVSTSRDGESRTPDLLIPNQAPSPLGYIPLLMASSSMPSRRTPDPPHILAKVPVPMTIKYDYLRFIGNRALAMNLANVSESPRPEMIRGEHFKRVPCFRYITEGRSGGLQTLKPEQSPATEETEREETPTEIGAELTNLSLAVVLPTGIEPASTMALVPKTSVSTYSTTGACGPFCIMPRIPYMGFGGEDGIRTRVRLIAKEVPHHSASSPCITTRGQLSMSS